MGEDTGHIEVHRLQPGEVRVWQEIINRTKKIAPALITDSNSKVQRLKISDNLKKKHRNNFELILCISPEDSFRSNADLLSFAQEHLSENGQLIFSTKSKRAPQPHFQHPRSYPQDVAKLCQRYFAHCKHYLIRLREGETRALFICSDHRIPSNITEDIEQLIIETEDEEQAAEKEHFPSFQTKHGADIKRLLAAIGANVGNLDHPTLQAIEHVLSFGDIEELLAKVEQYLSNAEEIVSRRTLPTDPTPDRILNILLLCWEPPTPKHGGGSVMSNYIKQLSVNHNVSVITNIYQEKNIEEMADLRRYAKKIIPLPRDIGWEPKLCPLADAPYWLKNQYSPYVHTAILNEVESGSYDVVQYEYLPMSIYPIGGIPRILVKHDIMYRSFIDIAEQKLVSEHMIPGIWASALQCFAYELSTDKLGFDAEIVFTHFDAECLLKYNPSLPIFLNPFGVNVSAFPPKLADSGKHLLYVGNYLHYPNREAVLQVAEEILPRVNAVDPHIDFNVVGSFMRPDVQKRLVSCTNVHVKGYVDSLVDEYHQAAAFISPIYSGRGMRVKHLEVLASGLPLITTMRGMAGIDLPEGECWLKAETHVEFVEKVLWCMENRNQAAAMGARAADAIRVNYSWEKRTEHLLAILHEVIA